MKNKDQLLLEEAYQSIYEAKESYANKGVVFRKKGNNDIGCCIGVDHVGSIKLSKDLIERIKNISGLKFYAEGIAAKDYSAEPGMIPFIQQHLKGYIIEPESWDEITEKIGKGTANPNNNIYWMFANHEENNLIETRYSKHTEGTILDALANATSFPKNVPTDKDKRREWIVYNLSQAGFSNTLKQKYSLPLLKKLMIDVEYSVYPGQQHPDTSTFLGKQVYKAELERNQTIYDLMSSGGCCFAGAGHLIELKQQFPNLEIVCEENIKPIDK